MWTCSCVCLRLRFVPFVSPSSFLLPYPSPFPSFALTSSPLPSATPVCLLNGDPLPLLWPLPWPLPLSLPLPLHLPRPCPFLSSPTNTSCLICFQYRHSCLVDCRSVIDEIGDGAEEVDLGGRSIAMRAYASWFNFKGADQQKSVGVLSGGERNRLQLAKVCCELCSERLSLQPLPIMVKHDIVTQQYDAAPCSLSRPLVVCYSVFLIPQFGLH